VRYNFLTPDHETICLRIRYFITTATYTGQFDIDMGDAPVGSYISLETGYETTPG